jgi:hypothetical protein
VYNVDTAGHERVLYRFKGAPDVANPLIAGVTAGGSAGSLYGTTWSGGTGGPLCNFVPAGCGVAYKLDWAGQETELHSFTNGADGGFPNVWSATQQATSMEPPTAAATLSCSCGVCT